MIVIFLKIGFLFHCEKNYLKNYGQSTFRPGQTFAKYIVLAGIKKFLLIFSESRDHIILVDTIYLARIRQD